MGERKSNLIAEKHPLEEMSHLSSTSRNSKAMPASQKTARILEERLRQGGLKAVQNPDHIQK